MSQLQQLRLRRRLIKHHLPLLALSTISILWIYSTRPSHDVIGRASFATAYPALVLLAATLLLGPWKLIAGKRNPVSDDLRRDVGIWAGALSLIHSVIGQCVHLRGKPWLYYIYPPRPHHTVPLRHDLFGFANYTGIFGTLLVLILFATSNDYSLRRLGTQQWKRLQRWNYALFGLVAVHAFAYQGIEKQKLHFVIFICISVVVTVALQLVGLQKTRSTAKRTPARQRSFQ